MHEILQRLVTKWPRRNETPVSPLVVEPSVGAQKQRLEGYCQDMLKSEYFSPVDFVDFVTNMVILLGYTQEALSYDRISIASNPLIDDDGTTITFQRYLREHQTPQVSATLKLESPSGIVENLQGYLQKRKDRTRRSYEIALQLRSEVPVETPQFFYSQISGKDEPVIATSKVYPSRQIDAQDEVQPFCQRVFDLYKKTKGRTALDSDIIGA